MRYLTPAAILLAALIIAYRPQLPTMSAYAEAGGTVPAGGNGGGTGGGGVMVNPDGSIELPFGRYTIVPLDRMQGNGTTGRTQQ
jgi:hypothetical protein